MYRDSILLRDLLDFTRDGEWGKGEFEDGLVEMVVIRGTDFEDVRNGQLSSVPVRFIKQHIAEYKALQAGDILIETAGGSKGRPTGRTLFITEKILRECDLPITCASFCRFLRVNPELAEPEFVFWYLQYLYGTGIMVNYQVQHTGVARFQYTTFAENVEIPIPPLPEQRAIAHILGALDDKIEANRRMNETLEATARAIFKSWFVDFDPVHYKSRGEHPPGMDTETAALFPDSFEESELGLIPSGWGIGVLDDITEFVIGGDWGKAERTKQETELVYCIRGADIPSLQEGGIGQMPIRYLKEASLKKRDLLDGDIVIEISGGSPTQQTGRVVLATDRLLSRLDLPLSFSNFCRLVRIQNNVSSKYIYLWMRWLYSIGLFFQYESGTTGIKNFAFTTFSNQHPLVLPSTDILSLFEDIIAPLFEKHQANGAESKTLAETRDALLPKLVSGEIRVGEMDIDADIGLS